MPLAFPSAPLWTDDAEDGAFAASASPAANAPLPNIAIDPAILNDADLAYHDLVRALSLCCVESERWRTRTDEKTAHRSRRVQ